MTWKPKDKVAQWRSLAEKWSKQTGTPVALILATIEQESGGQPHVTRYEPDYQRAYIDGSAKNLRNAKACGLTPQEAATSYGLMQLMFPLAYGYGARSKESLFDPDQNIRFGAAHLGVLLKKHSRGGEIDAGVIRAVAGAFNGGGSTSGYARNVGALYQRYEEWLQNG